MKLRISIALTLCILFLILLGLLYLLISFLGLPSFTLIIFTSAFVFLQWYASPYLIESIYKPRYEVPAWVEKLVEEVSKKAGVRVGKVGIIDVDEPNAFVFGRTKRDSRLILTKGLLKLSKDEIKAVIGHELGHVEHGDMVVMTFISFIPLLAYFIYLSLAGEEEAGAIAMIAFFTYFISNLLTLHLSRQREFYADEFSAKLGYARHLISALIKISYGSKGLLKDGLRTFYIVDPILARKEVKEAMKAERSFVMRLMELFQTHPLTYKRIEALKKWISGK